MYIAMNRFRVVKDQAKAFEQLWRPARATFTDEGFVGSPLKGPRRKTITLLVAHALGNLRGLPRLDEVRRLPQGARPRRQRAHPAADHRPSRVRRLPRHSGSQSRRQQDHARRRVGHDPVRKNAGD